MEGSLVAYKVFTNGSVLQASEINDNLMRQSVMVFSNAAARTAAITSPLEGMLTWLEDTNRYENYNGTAWVPAFGLTQILSQTIGTGVSTVTVSSAFSTSFDAYKVIVTDFVNSAAPNIYVKFNNSAGFTYQSVLTYFGYTSTVNVNQNLNASNLGIQIGLGATSSTSMEFDVLSPFLSRRTGVRSSSMQSSNPAISIGMDTNEASQTGFTITFSSGTITGGTVRVYGYKKD
jgi:hypothetical protein